MDIKKILENFISDISNIKFCYLVLGRIVAAVTPTFVEIFITSVNRTTKSFYRISLFLAK